MSHSKWPEFFDQVIVEVDQKFFDQVIVEVDQKFFDQVIVEVDQKFEATLLDMRSWGLHVAHDAFQNGGKLAKWNVNVVLRSLYKLFHNTAALPEELIIKKLMVLPNFLLNFAPFVGWKMYMFP